MAHRLKAEVSTAVCRKSPLNERRVESFMPVTWMKDFLQRATRTEHIHTDAHTHTARPSEGTWPLWWNNHFKIDFLWLGQTERDQRVILLEGKTHTHTLMLFQAVWQAGGLCIILAKMSDVSRCDVGFAQASPVMLSEDHLSCSSGPFYQSCSLTIWPNAPSCIQTHT